MYTLIKVGAEWCGPCKVQEEEFEKNPVQNVDYKKYDADSEEGEAICKKYGVMSMPTIILLDGEKEVHRWVGFTKSSAIQLLVK